MEGVCGVEDGVRCPDLEGWWAHFCYFDTGHEGPHVCGCNHVWAEGGDE